MKLNVFDLFDHHHQESVHFVSFPKQGLEIRRIVLLLTNLFNRKSAFWRFSTQQCSRVPHIGYKQFALEYQG